METKRDYYEILGVSPTADVDDVTAAYRVLVRRHADDKALFDEITEAYMTLVDPASREAYDRSRGRSEAADGSSSAPQRASSAPPGQVRCSNCGADSPHGQHYCGQCGFVLAPPPVEGSGAPKLGIGRLVLPDPEPSLAFESDEVLIGRGPECRVQLIADRYLSGKHARVTATMGIFSIEDLGSTNGTLLNGVKLEPRKPAQLHDGDVITVGQTEIRFELR